MISSSLSTLELSPTWIAQVLFAFSKIATPDSKSVANYKTSLKTYIQGVPTSFSLSLLHFLSPNPIKFENPAKLPIIPTQPKLANTCDPETVVKL